MDWQYLLLYSVNLTFIITNVYGWLLKRFYIPEAYKENFGELFPAARMMSKLYIFQLFELPYLFMIGRPEALFYVNGAALLFFTSYLVILVRGYFFLELFNERHKILYYMHPVFVCWIALLLPLFDIVEFTPTYRYIMTAVVLILAGVYINRLDVARQKLVLRVREIDEDEFSNDEDFPVKFARSIKWLPLLICLLLVGNFIVNDQYVKLVRDIVFTVLNVWFAIHTLNPHRRTKKLPQVIKKIDDIEKSTTNVKHRLTQKYCRETEQKLMDVMREKKLYLEEHLTMNDLTEVIHTNKNYLSEVIARSEYKSFYRLVNTMRIEYACEMLKNDSSAKLEQVALASGFTSGSSFSQVFKRIKDMSPKEYISMIHAE